MNTDKVHIRHISHLCALKGIKHAVLSPGSRCAPLTIAFNRQPEIECISIVDERSAAFYALGIAQQTQTPVALICTSGSAILNYAPAIAEAYYQKVPLLVFTADRPNEWIDQGENQSIQQFEVYKNYVKRSFQLPTQVHDDEDLWYSNRIISEAINTSIYPDFGPVHVNVPLREPLYNISDQSSLLPKVIDEISPVFHLSDSVMSALLSAWNAQSKKLIVVGQQKAYHAALENALQRLSEDPSVVVFTEATSNVDGENFIRAIDPFVEIISEKQLDQFVPDIILTLGGGIVSKKLKFLFRKEKKAVHWHLSQSGEHWDNFQSLSKVINADATWFIQQLADRKVCNTSTYRLEAQNLREKIQSYTTEYVKQIPFCDFSVFNQIITHLPPNSNLQLGNSTSIRYANLLNVPFQQNILVNGNRGVSGIDGTLSTAAGAAHVNQKTTICILGDLSFMYDSNALWNKHIHRNLKIILINNSGGNIFRIIPGPEKLPELEDWFETKREINVSHLAKQFNILYDQVDSSSHNDLLVKMSALLESKKAGILEIFTPNEDSANTLKNYFKNISQSIDLQ